MAQRDIGTQDPTSDYGIEALQGTGAKQAADLKLGSTPAGPSVTGTLPSITDEPQPMARMGPPDVFHPSADAPVRLDQQNSFMGSVSRVLQGFGAGNEIPLYMKMRLAQQKSQMEESSQQLAWANYKDSHILAQQTMHMHNQDMITQGMNLLP